MKENEPYKIIKQLLEKVHLNPRKKDWEQMQVILDKKLPVTNPTNWFKPTKIFFAGGIIVVVTAVVFFLKHEHTETLGSNKSVSQNNIASTQKTTVQNSSDSFKAISPFNNSVSNNNVDVKKGTLKNDTSVTNKISYENKIADLKNNRVNAIVKKPNKTTTKKDIELKKNKLIQDQNNNAVFANEEKLSNNIHQHGKTINNIVISDKLDNNINSRNSIKNDSIIDLTKNNTAKKLIPNLYDTTAIKLSATTNDFIKKPSPQKNKTATNKKIKSNNYAAGFNYGLQLSPLQFYTSPADSKISVGFIPGLLGEYLFTKNLGLHLGIFPYQSNNLNSNILSTISSSNNDTSSVTTINYLSKLHTFNAELSLLYKQKNLSFEAGLGIQSALNGNGKIVTSYYIDTIKVTQSDTKMYYHRNDAPFYYVNKTNLFYHFNAFYSINQWQLGVGYYQNTKGWMKDNSAKPVGNIQLQIRYSLLDLKKK